VAVFGAIWINAPIQRYVEAVQDIENFERGGGFRVTTRISTPPRLEDFADLHLPEDDLGDLRTCRVGNCEMRLSEGALERLPRTAGAPSGSVTRRGLLVCYSEPQPIGRPQRLHGHVRQTARAERGAAGSISRLTGDEEDARAEPVMGPVM
jgi:hypothetical protein